ncbi:MAG TPA: hypothetical protein VFP11_14230, partial [Candidatus Angelobacter sp.]|nr:hypothetical protein [Candidatus Angelobacter sp.]
WLMDVLRGLAEGRTTEKTAGIMLYGLQLAMVNAQFTTFQDTDHKEMVRKAPTTRPKPQRTRRNTEEEASENFTAKGAEVAKKEEPSGRFTAENAEIAEKSSPNDGDGSRIEDGLEPRNAEGNLGVESAKSIFFGVEPGEGVADNRPVSPPPEPPRKSNQSEILIIAKDVEHHAGR